MAFSIYKNIGQHPAFGQSSHYVPMLSGFPILPEEETYTVEGYDTYQLMRFAGAKRCLQERTREGQRIIDEAGRVLLELNLIDGSFTIIQETPVLVDYADRGWDE